MVVRELVALLGIQTDKKGFDDAEGGMNGLIGAAKAAAAAFAAFKLTQWAKDAVQEIATVGDWIDKMSKRTGFATDQLQGLEHAAELSGASLGVVENAIRRLQAASVEAAEGSSMYADEFKRLGIEVTDAGGKIKSGQDLLLEVADGMQKLESHEEKVAFATKALGRAGTQLIPMFEGGAEGIREMMREMAELGGVMEDDMIAQSAELIDHQRRLDVVTRGLKLAIAKELMPWVNRVIGRFIEWWKTNGKIIRQKVQTFFARVASVMERLWKVGARLVKVVMSIWEALPGAAKIAIVVAAFVKWRRAFAFLLTPMGKVLLFIGLLILIIEDLVTWVEGGDSAIGKLLKTLSELTGLPIEAYLKEAALGFKQFLEDISEDPSGAITAFWEEMVIVAEGYIASAGEFWATTWNDAKGLFGEFVQFVSDAWDTLGKVAQAWIENFSALWTGLQTTVTDTLSSIWDSIVAWVDKVSAKITEPFTAVGGAVRGLLGREPGQVQMTGIGDLIAGAGAGAVAPRTVAPPARGGVVSSPNTKVDITVNPGPGMSEERIGVAVATHVQKVINRNNRAAIQALLPAAATPGV